MVKGWIPPKLDRDFTVVGKSFNRTNGVEKVTGRAKYAGDIKFPGMLHVKILRTPHAHARIKSIDTRAARSGSWCHGYSDKGQYKGMVHPVV